MKVLKTIGKIWLVWVFVNCYLFYLGELFLGQALNDHPEKADDIDDRKYLKPIPAGMHGIYSIIDAVKIWKN